MRKTLLRTTTLGAAAALFGLIAYTAPAQSAPPQPPPAERGCYNIIGGTGGEGSDAGALTHAYTYTFFRSGADHLVHDAPGGAQLTAHAHVVTGYEQTKADPEQADAELVLTTENATGEDCSSVRYRLQILDESGQLLADLVVPGNTTDKVTWKTTVPFTHGEDRHARFVVTTETTSGRVVDTAPDNTDGYATVLLDGSGGAAGWS